MRLQQALGYLSPVGAAEMSPALLQAAAASPDPGYLSYLASIAPQLSQDFQQERVRASRLMGPQEGPTQAPQFGEWFKSLAPQSLTQYGQTSGAMDEPAAIQRALS